MDKFYEDPMTPAEYGKAYAGKNMAEIQDAENARFDAARPAVDEAHGGFVGEYGGRRNMLTVGRLVEWLLRQDQDACVLAYEQNSDAYIEQPGGLPSPDVCTVEQCRADMEKSLRGWYRGTAGAEGRIQADLERTFRYAQPGDVVIGFR